MTTVARPSPAPNLLARRASGTAAEVAAIVAHVRRSGRLVSMTLPQLLPDGRVSVDVVYLASSRSPRRTVRRRQLVVAAVALVVVVGVAGAVLWLLSLLLGVLAQAAAVAGVLLVLWLLLSAANGHACRGLHCGGCNGR